LDKFQPPKKVIITFSAFENDSPEFFPAKLEDVDIDEAEEDVVDLESIVYKSPTIRDKEADKPILEIAGNYKTAPCECIEVTKSSDSFTMNIDQSKLTFKDTGVYTVKTTLTDEWYEDTK